MKPDEWSIKTILNTYAKLWHENETQYYENEIKIDEYYQNQKRNEKLCIQAMRLIFTSEHYYGDLFLLEDFINHVRDGFFIPYDGTGCYVDFEGNILTYINWENPSDCPEKAVFVAWYNK